MQQITLKQTTKPLRRSSVERLRLRLLITVAGLIICLILNSAVGLFVSNNQQALGNQKVTLNDHINQLQQSMIDQETGLRGYIITNNAAFLTPLNTGRTDFNNLIIQIQSDANQKGFEATLSALKGVNDAANSWQNNFANPQIANMRAGRFQAARSDQFNAEGKSLFDAFRRSISRVQDTANLDLSTLQNQANLVDWSVISGTLLLTIVMIVIIWRIFSRFINDQYRHLEILKDTAAAFGEGNLGVRVEGIKDTELMALGKVFNKMATLLQQQQVALKDRDILEQVSHLNSILTDSLDLTELMQNFLRGAFSLLDIQVGALYLYDTQEQRLNLYTSRGLPIGEMEGSFALGEGLIGRVAAERKSLAITQQNQDVSQIFKIKTMMGSVVPSSLYHMPLIRGNELLGVLAIGSMYPMREQTRNVFNVVASNIAAAISNTQSYARIQEQARELTERGREKEESNRALRHQRDELTVLNSALEEANRARSQFLSTMSHELRTPLTSIIGFSQMLLRPSAKTPMTERQSGNIERILKNAQHLLVLINDVLDLAKVEAGRMDVNAAEVSLPNLLHALVDETRSIAIERKLSLEVFIEDEIDNLETDPQKLRQILLNLISNALKFTEQGGVTITAKRRLHTMTDEAEKTKAEQIMIAVKDTGIGIPAEKQEHIFEAFYQVDNSNSRNYGGTGLGLSIVRELTTLLGGRVEIESVPGQGTTFTVVLPMHARDRQSIQEVRLNSLHTRANLDRKTDPAAIFNSAWYENDGEENPYLVVAIDDNPDVLQLISASLEQSPYRVVGVQDSTQAVAVVQELQPRAITLDVMMPRVNGWQILHQLKSNPITSSIPVILLTVLEDRSAGYVLGADEYLVKPVTRDALLSTLHQLTAYLPDTIEQAVMESDNAHSMEIMDPDRKPAIEHSKQIKPILLVHNEHNIHQFIERIMHKNGYDLTTSDSQDIMELIEKAPPDMLMLVVQMDKQEFLHDEMVVDQAEDPPQSSPPLESEDSPSPENPASPEEPPASS